MICIAPHRENSPWNAQVCMDYIITKFLRCKYTIPALTKQSSHIQKAKRRTRPWNGISILIVVSHFAIASSGKKRADVSDGRGGAYTRTPPMYRQRDTDAQSLRPGVEDPVRLRRCLRFRSRFGPHDDRHLWTRAQQKSSTSVSARPRRSWTLQEISTERIFRWYGNLFCTTYPLILCEFWTCLIITVCTLTDQKMASNDNRPVLLIIIITSSSFLDFWIPLKVINGTQKLRRTLFHRLGHFVYYPSWKQWLNAAVRNCF